MYAKCICTPPCIDIIKYQNAKNRLSIIIL
nr:MAG TPA: hypothetical protein [Caudoviricetes sp.]